MKHLGKIVGGFLAIAALTTLGISAPAQARDSHRSDNSRWDSGRDHDRGGRYDRNHRSHRGDRHWNHRHDRHYGRSNYRPYRYYVPPPRWTWNVSPYSYYYGYY